MFASFIAVSPCSESNPAPEKKVTITDADGFRFFPAIHGVFCGNVVFFCCLSFGFFFSHTEGFDFLFIWILVFLIRFARVFYWGFAFSLGTVSIFVCKALKARFAADQTQTL